MAPDRVNGLQKRKKNNLASERWAFVWEIERIEITR